MPDFTVKDLREALNGLPDTTRVILSKDAEGNQFRWCASADFDGVLIEDHGWEANIYSSSWSAVEADMDQEEWDDYLKRPRVLVLTPIN